MNNKNKFLEASPSLTQVLLPNYSKKRFMALAQNQEFESMEWNSRLSPTAQHHLTFDKEARNKN